MIMFSRSTMSVWIGIAALSGMFLMGQDTWPPPACVDNDADGYGSPGSAYCTYPLGDCNDANAEVHPGAPELCDGIDNQCPGDAGYGEVDEVCGPMAEIPAGCFDMGDNFGEGASWERPVHSVCVSGFQVDVHEVTNAEYKACEDAGGCTAPHYSYSMTRATYYGDPSYGDFPVIAVDWYQAEDYCAWAGKRLPTEAEWEYAARGGLAGKRYPWGDTKTCDDACYGRWDSTNECFNFCHNGICDNDTHPVGNYTPNGYGLYDMAGNVWEWVNDWYQSDYYTVSPPADPTGPVTGTERVLRGGSWTPYHQSPGDLRVAARNNCTPGDCVHPNLGFRCAR